MYGIKPTLYRVGENRDRFEPMSLNVACRTDGYTRKHLSYVAYRLGFPPEGVIFQGIENLTNRERMVIVQVMRK